MKKVLLGVMITLIVLVGGCSLLMKGVSDSASKAVNDIQDKKESKDEQYKEMAKNIKWEQKNENGLSEIVGIFENTSSEEIEYIQFNYKTYDNKDVVIDKSFTNESNIKPNEKREVKILLTNHNYARYEIEVSSSVI